jgi:hypothetical protein
VNEPPSAEFLRRLRPIPTYRDHPATSPVDIEGQDPAGTAVRVPILSAADPVLILFLSSDCLGCVDLWENTAELCRSIPPAVQMVIVTKGPEAEDAAAIAALAPPRVAAGPGASGIPTVMSTRAYADYRVGGAPFLVLVTASAVLTEGVAWGIEETARATRAALEGLDGSS